VSLALVIQYLVAGVTYGTIYAVVGIGFNIIYNTTGIINFAQGEFVMLGGMVAVSLYRHVPLPLAIAGAVLVTMAVGAFIELTFIHWLKKATVLRMIMVTIGISILIREAALMIWGHDVRVLPYFTGNEISAIDFLGARISQQVIWVVAVCAFMVMLTTAFFQWTMVGRQMRACASNQVGAAVCGLPIRSLVTLSFVLSAGMGALAGCVVCPITYTQYGMGTGLAIKGFTVAILGGLGNSMGAVAAGLLLGIVESFTVSTLPTAYKDTVSIAILLAILFLRPSGLFGARASTRA
jgi:branched-chain amino acid transport system permease protein